LLITAAMKDYSISTAPAVRAPHRVSTAPAFRAPHRISITLAHNTYQQLLERSDREGRSLSNLAAYLLETSLDKG
jgi:hypothetical protein